MDKAIILASGGLDSCVTAAIAAQKYELAFLHVNYGQKTQNRELKSFNEIADFYNVKNKLIVDLTYLKQIGGTALIDADMEIPAADLKSKEIPSTYVPFRNGNIISIAAAWAEVIKAENIFIGVVEEDSSGYPDCRELFINSMEKAINSGTRPELDLKIHAPLIKLNKTEIIKKGNELNAPVNLSWSCYQNEKEACGVCESCALRLRAFQKLGLEDPIPYEKRPQY
ncbi:MAG: 7-cyano-7-deazaguanine synthase QueC [Calditrichia bacterium]|nr:7-cyano-7-deazaguanine synthase QueC [Calditrichia bacterium]